MIRVFGPGARTIALFAACSLLFVNVLKAGSPETENKVVILKSEDPVPEKAIKVDAVALGYNANADYSYYELIEQARGIAFANDANVIKITEHVNRSNNTPEKIKVELYKAENATAYEQEFSWQKGRMLTWDDFRGPIPAAAPHNTAAATFCGIGFETNTVRTKDDDVKVYVYNTFYKNNSWAKPQYMDDRVLAHEQGHFDLCEVYTRKLRKRLHAANINVGNMKTTLKSIYKEVQEAYIARQEAYEHETQHGVDVEIQKEWQENIAEELAASEDWML